MRGMRIEAAVFTSLIGVLLLGSVYWAWKLPLRASILILALGGAGVLLAALQIALDLRAGRPVRERPAFDAPGIDNRSRWGHLEIWGWIGGFYLAIHLVGFPAATPLFVFTYAKANGARWPLALGLSALAWAFLYGVFEKILHVPWPSPLIWSLVRML